MNNHKDFAQILVFDGPQYQAQKKDSMNHYRRLEQEYDSFKKMRAWVIKNMHHLKGQKVEIEVHHITNIETHDCIVIDDLLLVSYTEAAEMIMKILQKKQKDREDGSTTTEQLARIAAAATTKSTST